MRMPTTPEPLTILAQFQEISARTGFPVEALMEARERAAEVLLDEAAELLERARLDFEIAEAVGRRSRALAGGVR